MMTKYHQFSLQKVLDLKELIEESRAVELEKSRQNLQSDELRLIALRQNKNKLLIMNGNHSSSKQFLSPHTMQVSMEYVSQLSDRIRAQEKTVEKSTHRVSKHRNALLEASREKKALEILREKQADQHKKFLQKKDLLNESEIALQLQRRHQSREDER